VTLYSKECPIAQFPYFTNAREFGKLGEVGNDGALYLISNFKYGFIAAYSSTSPSSLAVIFWF